MNLRTREAIWWWGWLRSCSSRCGSGFWPRVRTDGELISLPFEPAHSGLTNFLDVQVQGNTDMVLARAQLPNSEGMLIPGGIVGVMVERGPPHQSLVVSQSAVVLDQAGHYVMLVNNEKKVEQRRITTGVERYRNRLNTDQRVLTEVPTIC